MIFLYIVLIYFLYLISAVFIGQFIKLREDKKSEKVNQYIENEFNKFVSDKIKYNKLDKNKYEAYFHVLNYKDKDGDWSKKEYVIILIKDDIKHYYDAYHVYNQLGDTPRIIFFDKKKKETKIIENFDKNIARHLKLTPQKENLEEFLENVYLINVKNKEVMWLRRITSGEVKRYESRDEELKEEFWKDL